MIMLFWVLNLECDLRGGRIKRQVGYVWISMTTLFLGKFGAENANYSRRPQVKVIDVAAATTVVIEY